LGATRSFELKPEEERVVAVGSAASADIRLEMPGVSPIHFYFERIGREMWIVPAYCVSELRVNAARVVTPYKLSHRSVIEFGSTRMVAKVSCLPATHVTPTVSPSDARRELCCKSYLAQLPDEDAPTYQAWTSEELASNAALTLSAMALVTGRRGTDGSEAKSHRRDESRQPVAMSMDVATTRRDVHSLLSSTQVVEAHVTKSVVGPAVGNETIELSNVAAPAAREIVEVLALNKTLLGIASASVAINKPKSNASPSGDLGAKRAIGASVPSQVSTLFDICTIGKLARRRDGWLTRLGLLAKRYPIRVCMAAIAVALASSGTVVIATRYFLRNQSSGPKKSPQHDLPRQPKAPQNSAESGVQSVSQTDRPSIVVVSPVPNSIGILRDSASGNARSVAPVEFRNAALSLVQGRYAEAQVAYAGLASHPKADQTNFVLSQLLARRIGSRCTSTHSSDDKIACPEVIQ
jgi:hypothetical protein